MERAIDSTGTGPAPLRADAWAQRLRTHFAGVELTDVAADCFQGRVSGRAMAGGSIWRMEGCAQVLRRREPPQRAPAPLKLLLQLRGASHMAQGGRNCELRAGQFSLLDGERPFELRMDTEFAQLLLCLPRTATLSRYPGLAWRTARGSREESAGDQLLHSYLSALAERAQHLDAAQLGHAQMALQALLGGSSLLAPGRSSASQLLAQARNLVALHLSDSAFNAESVARQLRVSRRYLDQLFSAEGLTLDRYLWVARLQQAALALTETPGASVTSICHACGFSDAAHFARAFKRQFGMAPSAWRARARA